ncbi:F-box/LRR-repeat protein 13 [Lactuca sativa]|uniref:F-box domain-containing protein n=1 Tax=Lactuca sativa TaxID=4236 RepID=A0A9R1V0S2_LACSA|nr:F-box/LRR-repeat protein 13 [Lactuca sativa]KAJ0196181.1 hypothetical protein LSAT_V11C700347180 [Lactuca sativa]
MKKSKQAKASEPNDGVDMFSKLPDHILNLILSGLPSTEEVIRTSILSTRWRYLWTSVPSIDIDYLRGLTSQKKFKKRKFKEFVYSVLLKNSLDLDSFRLCCANDYSMSTVRQWIEAAVGRKVKVVDLIFRPREQYKDAHTIHPDHWINRWDFEDIKLPLSLVSCGSLEVLRLFLFGRGLRLPKLTGFLTLRVLELNAVEFACEDEKLELFFKSLSLLEELSLIHCLIDEHDVVSISCPNLKNLRIVNQKMIRFEQWDGEEEELESMCPEVRICCPKLVFLELIGRIALNFFFESLDCLKKAMIHAESINPEGLSLSRISHVEYLSLNLYIVLRCLSQVDVWTSLPNLKTLELTIDDYAPVALTNEMQIFEREYWNLEKAAAMKILARKVRKVEFVEFDGLEWELNVARCLLEHGNALEEMVFIWDNKDMYIHENSMEAMKKVSNFHKASSTVKLINSPKSS